MAVDALRSGRWATKLFHSTELAFVALREGDRYLVVNEPV
jgi:hypothetical protein